MGRRALVVLCLVFMTIVMASCGQTYKLESISISPAAGYSLTNASPQGALMVTASYSNSKTANVTTGSSYEILASALGSTTAPPNAVMVNNSGVVIASGATMACTWNGATSSPYMAQASYTENGVTATASVPINVTTASGCSSQASATPSLQQSTAASEAQ